MIPFHCVKNDRWEIKGTQKPGGLPCIEEVLSKEHSNLAKCSHVGKKTTLLKLYLKIFFVDDTCQCVSNFPIDQANW